MDSENVFNVETQLLSRQGTFTQSDRYNYIKNMAEAVLTDNESADESQAKDAEKIHLQKVKLKDAVGELLARKKLMQSMEANEKKKQEKIFEAHVYIKNQIELLRKRLRDEKYSELNLSCKNIINYIKKNEIPNEQFYKFVVYLYWTQAFIGTKNSSKAKKYLTKCQQTSDGTAEQENELKILEGKILLISGHKEEAIEIWEELLPNLSPNGAAHIHHEIAQCLFELKNLEESSDYAKKCVDAGINPWQCYAHLLLGQIALKKGEAKTARLHFSQAKEGIHTTQSPTQTLDYINDADEAIQNSLK